jgi:hypothetical protein
MPYPVPIHDSVMFRPLLRIRQTLLTGGDFTTRLTEAMANALPEERPAILDAIHAAHTEMWDSIDTGSITRFRLLRNIAESRDGTLAEWATQLCLCRPTVATEDIDSSASAAANEAAWSNTIETLAERRADTWSGIAIAALARNAMQRTIAIACGIATASASATA